MIKKFDNKIHRHREKNRELLLKQEQREYRYQDYLKLKKEFGE